MEKNPRRVAAHLAERGLTWVERQDPASRRGATVGWFRVYRAADGPLYAMVFTGYFFVTAIPAMVALASYIYGDPTQLADRLAQRLKLGASTVALLDGVLVGAATHRFTSMLIAVASVVVFGSGFGRVLQLIHARVWRVDVSKSRLADQERYFLVLAALIVLVVLYLLQTAALGSATTSGLLFVPLWMVVLVGYFVAAPWLLLHRLVSAAALLPGALFVAAGCAGLRLASPIVLARWLTSYSRNYGGFGIVLAMFFWLLLVGNVVVIGAALSPPLAHRRALRVLHRSSPDEPVVTAH